MTATFTQPHTDLPDIPLVKTEPWRHQTEAFWFCRSKRSALIACDMGTGKSRIVVDLIVNRGHRRTLILCPKSVVRAWPVQFERHAALPVRVLALDEGTIAERQAHAALCYEHLEEPLAVVINYDAAQLEPFASWTAKVQWDLVVCDESHRIKAPTGSTGKWVRRLARNSRCRLCLSGTPMAHSPLDLWGQAAFLEPARWGRFREFKARYAMTKAELIRSIRSAAATVSDDDLARSLNTDLGTVRRYRSSKWPIQEFEEHVIHCYRNEDDLNRRFYEMSFRVAAEDVLDLPPVTHEERTCKLGLKAAKLYRELERDLYSQIDAGEVTAANALVKLLRLQQVTGGHITTDDGTVEAVDGEKAALLADLLEDLAPEEPVVVFARFTADLESIKRSSGRTGAELSGRVNQLASWQAGEANLLAVQIGAGSEGIDLTRARYCVFYSLGFSLGQYLQALARCHRPGQERPVHYYHLLAAGTVDERVYAALKERRDVIESILAARKDTRSYEQ